jgi:CubicO group peptidase (beta-lactamase class C family)
VKDLLPTEWKLIDEWADEKSNLRDLLSHVSGLPRCVQSALGSGFEPQLTFLRHEYSYSPDDNSADMIKRMRYLRPAYELRETWHYNNQVLIILLVS